MGADPPPPRARASIGRAPPLSEGRASESQRAFFVQQLTETINTDEEPRTAINLLRFREGLLKPFARMYETPTDMGGGGSGGDK